MLTKEENELLTRIGPGTPCGELFRRYWLPVAVASELTAEQPAKFVRVLGEDLVLFRDKSANVGLIQDHCAHRGASLVYGRVEERGIACAYHGWLYDTSGNCLECPAEPAGSKFHLTVKMLAYPVQRFAGLYWAYLGPLPAPVIPKYDIWVRPGLRRIAVCERLDCNWLQMMENDLDPAHLPILHQDTQGRIAANTTRGLIDEVDHVEFSEIPYGILKKRAYKSGIVDRHPHIFPNCHRQTNVTPIKVPIDDTHTKMYFVFCYPPGAKGDNGQANAADGAGDCVEHYDEYPQLWKEPADALHPFTRFKMNITLAQDHMVFETPGPIADREHERLASSDRGIILYRKIVRREIAKVQRGLDPLGVVRDPDHEVIDTHLEELPERALRRPFGVRIG